MKFGRSPHRTSHSRTKIRRTPGRLLATTKRRTYELFREKKLAREYKKLWRESHRKTTKKREKRNKQHRFRVWHEIHMNHVQTKYAVRYRLMYRMQIQGVTLMRQTIRQQKENTSTVFCSWPIEEMISHKKITPALATLDVDVSCKLTMIDAVAMLV